MIKPTSHCLICENSKRDFKSGIYCSITNERPKFLNKCPNTSFGTILEKKIEEVNKKIKLIENKKGDTTTHLITYLIISGLVLSATYFLTIYLWQKGWMSSITITVGVGGLGLIPYAIAPLNKYKTTLKLAKESKNELDKTLEIYGLNYDIEISIKNGPHDIVDVDTKLKLNRINKKQQPSAT